MKQTPIQAPITPGVNPQDSWGTHYAKFGIGGLLVVADEAERNAITQERKIDKIVYNKQTKQFNTWDGKDWKLLDLTSHTNHNASYLAYMLDPTIIPFIEESAENKAYVWFDNPVYENLSNIISLDRNKKTIILSKGLFYLNFRIYSDSSVKKAGNITISIVDSNNKNKVLSDSDGHKLLLSNPFAKDEYIGEMFIDGVIQIDSTTHLRLHIETSCGEFYIEDRHHGASGFIIQELRDVEQTSPPFLQWMIDTGVTPIITSYFFGKGFKKTSIDSLKAGDVGTTNFLSDYTIREPSGEFLYGLKNGKVITEPSKLAILLKDFTYFEYGIFLNHNKTVALRGHNIEVYGKMLPHYQHGDYVLAFAYWDGAPNQQTTKIVNSITTTGVITYNTGWHHVGQLYFNELNITEEAANDGPRSGYAPVVIPQAAVNLVAFIVPVTNKPSDAEIYSIRLDAAVDFTAHIVNHEELHEHNGFLSEHKFTHSIGHLPDVGAGQDNRLKATAKDICDVVWFETANDIVNNSPIKKLADKKSWVFNKDGNVLINVAFKGKTLLSNHVSTILFYANRRESSGQNIRIIKQSIRRFVLPKTGEAGNCDVTFPLDVKFGEIIKFYVKTDADNECEIVYDPGEQGFYGNVLDVNMMYMDTGKNYNI